jgi:zinc protease
MIGYKAPPLGHADHVALTILNEIMFGGRSARVYRSLIKQKELATELRGWVSTFTDPGLYEVWMTARGEHKADELEAALKLEIDNAKKAEPSADELERAKNRLELAFLQGMETASGKAEQVGFYDTVLGDPGAGFSRLDAYRAVTAADVLRVAKAYFVDAHRTVIHVLPDGTAGSAEEDDDEDDAAVAHKLPRAKAARASKRPVSK